MKTEWRKKGCKKQSPLHYNWCGLDDVYLVSGFERVPAEKGYEEYGDGVVIQDLEGLHRAIAEHLVLTKKSLSGKEIRFLRERMDLSQRGLATLMRTTDQAVARWEKGQTNISGPAEMLLRVLYMECVSKSIDVHALSNALTLIDDVLTKRQLFTESDGKWMAVAA